MGIIESLDKPIANLSIFLTAKSLNETLLRKIEEKEKIKIQEQSIDKRLIIKAPTLISKSNLMSDIIALSERGSSQDVNIFSRRVWNRKRVNCKTHTLNKVSSKARLLPLLIVAVEI